jgi:hypothetical protein
VTDDWFSIAPTPLSACSLCKVRDAAPQYTYGSSPLCSECGPVHQAEHILAGSGDLTLESMRAAIKVLKENAVPSSNGEYLTHVNDRLATADDMHTLETLGAGPFTLVDQYGKPIK